MAEKGLNCGINKTTIMATKITVPDIGDFENVEIIEILAKPGTIVQKNDPIVTLESDKSSVEVPSPFTGTVSSLEVKKRACLRARFFPMRWFAAPTMTWCSPSGSTAYLAVAGSRGRRSS